MVPMRMMSRQSIIQEEVSAWANAEVLAKDCPFPPTAEFYQYRDIALNTYRSNPNLGSSAVTHLC
jgi:hypothetical protein